VKIVLERPKSLMVTAMTLSFTMIVGFGLAPRKGQIDTFGDFANLIHTLPGLPCKIVTSFRTFPERMDPTCSECR
jgi:hypothetical protein